jgi:hypothetical protein
MDKLQLLAELKTANAKITLLKQEKAILSHTNQVMIKTATDVSELASDLLDGREEARNFVKYLLLWARSAMHVHRSLSGPNPKIQEAVDEWEKEE